MKQPLLKYFRFFYGYLGNSVLLALVSSLLVALLDGFGLAMFLPLLQAAGGETATAGPGGGDLRFLLDGLQAMGLTVTLATVLGVMVLFFVLKGVARFVMDFYRAVLQQRFANAIRLRNLDLLVGAEFKHFSGAHSGKIQNTMSSEVGRLNQAYLNYFTMLQYLIMTAVYVVLAYVVNPKFAAIVVVGGVFSNLAFVWINAATKSASTKISQGMNSYQGYLIESVASFKFLKATNLLARYRDKIELNVLETERQHRRIGVLNALTTAVREPLVVLVVVAAIMVQTMVFGQSLSLIIVSLLFLYRALTSVIAVQNCYNSFLAVSGSIDNVTSFTQEMAGAQEERGGIPFSGLQNGIRVNHLQYAYGTKEVLHDLSFRIDRYQTIGIVGESGSGKTTLVNLLCALLSPENGMILVDGTDINRFDKATYRKHIGYVTQEPQVFSDTIRNNVTCWGGGQTPDEVVWKALRLAHAEQFVRELPRGLDTVVGINGINLSGGQRQRISIARELYRKVDLLIFDEATSALDSRSEHLIQENIDTLAGSLTMVVIAHRLSTVRRADKLIFLKAGGGYEIGSYTALHQRSRSFRNMVDLQTV